MNTLNDEMNNKLNDEMNNKLNDAMDDEVMEDISGGDILDTINRGIDTILHSLGW